MKPGAKAGVRFSSLMMFIAIEFIVSAWAINSWTAKASDTFENAAQSLEVSHQELMSILNKNIPKIVVYAGAEQEFQPNMHQDQGRVFTAEVKQISPSRY